MPSLYNIVIANSTGAAPNDGFIDVTTIAQYVAAGNPGPTTLALSLAKTRANVRYKFLSQQLSLDTTVYVTSPVAVGANCNSEASTFTFVAHVEHGDGNLYCYDETNNNAILTGIPALVRMVARALTENRTAMELAYYDPTTSGAPGNAVQANRMGIRIDSQAIGAASANLTAATGLITVTKIA